MASETRFDVTYTMHKKAERFTDEDLGDMADMDRGTEVALRQMESFSKVIASPLTEQEARAVAVAKLQEMVDDCSPPHQPEKCLRTDFDALTQEWRVDEEVLWKIILTITPVETSVVRRRFGSSSEQP